MAKIQDEIAKMFIEKLTASQAVAPEMIERLRALLSAKKKVTAEDLVEVFSPPAGGDAK